MSRVTSHGIAEVDRDQCIDLLNDAYSQGRFDKAELEVRIGRVLTTEHPVELEELRSDLPTVEAAVPPRRRGKWETLVGAGALVIALGIAGVAAARIESQPAEEATCIATGLTVSDTTGCPELSDQQVELMDNADRAVAAAEQVAALTSEVGGAKLDRLSTRASSAADRGRDAVAHAQLLVALDPDGAETLDLAPDAKKAKTAANDAIRAAVEANRIANR